jgi:hypothetical protein
MGFNRLLYRDSEGAVYINNYLYNYIAMHALHMLSIKLNSIISAVIIIARRAGHDLTTRFSNYHALNADH